MSVDIIRVFIYDELMNESVFKEKGLAYRDKFSVTLSAFKRVFNKVPLDNGGMEGLGDANIVPTPDNLGMMIGMMYEIHEDELPKLDKIYNCPDEYTRKVMNFTRHDFATIKGYVYFAPQEKTDNNLKPSKAKLKMYRATKKSFDMLSFSRLMNTPTCD